MKASFCLLILSLFAAQVAAQLDTYDHKMELSGNQDLWHKIILNEALFGKVQNDFSDVRIYGITNTQDTIEAPYLLRIKKEKIAEQTIAFKTVNSAKNSEGYYVTYEIPESETINQIALSFKNQNFDWKVGLEGSHTNGGQWFTIIEDQRILSINNDQTNYSFTDLTFPDSNYHYYRLLIKSPDKPELLTASISYDQTIPAHFETYSIKSLKVDHTKLTKHTVVDVDLGKKIPLSYLKINVSDAIDYYRPVSIAYIRDSVHTEKGWKYNYHHLTSGIMTSLEKNEFHFESTLVKQLRITLQNQDNQALTIENVEPKGYVHELVTRLNTPATYCLAFGKINDKVPSYDIAKVTTNIPENLTALQMGPVQEIQKKETDKAAPLFENKLWLWAVMIVIILILGWFTLTMMRNR